MGDREVDSFQFPILKVRETFKHEKYLFGVKEIVDYLIKHNFILPDVLNEHVEYTKESILLNQNNFEEILKEVFDTPILAWQIYFSPRTNELNRAYHTVPKLRMVFLTYSYALKNTLKAMFRNLKRRKSSEDYNQLDFEGKILYYINISIFK